MPEFELCVDAVDPVGAVRGSVSGGDGLGQPRVPQGTR